MNRVFSYTRFASCILFFALFGNALSAQQLDLRAKWLQTFSGRLNNLSFQSSESALGISAGSGGRVAIVGYFQGRLIDTDGIPLTSQTPLDQTAGFVAINNANGNPQQRWVRAFPGVLVGETAGRSRAQAVALDRTGSSYEVSSVYVSGWYENKVDFGDGNVFSASGINSKDVFISKIDTNPSNNSWTHIFRSTGAAWGEDRGLGIALMDAGTGTRNQASDGEGEPDSNHDRTENSTIPFIVVCGEFGNTMDADPDNSMYDDTVNSVGRQDGFVAVLDSSYGDFIAVQAIGTAGDDRVQAVTNGGVDPVTHNPVFYVTGYLAGARQIQVGSFSGENIWRATALSGPNRNLFVAKFELTLDGLVRDWLYVATDLRSSAGTGIVSNEHGSVYVTGYREPSLGRRDSVLLRINDIPDEVHPHYSLAWKKLMGGTGDEFGQAICLDGIGRILVTGSFGARARGHGQATPSYTTDLNPDPTGQDLRASAGGEDIFVSRFLTDGRYDGSLVFGGEWDESAEGGIAFDPQNSQLYLAGGFGAEDAPSSYTVDFNELAGSTRGKSDIFMEALGPAFEFVSTQISLVMDVSGSVENDEFHDMCEHYSALVEDPFTIPQDGSVALNLVQFADEAVQIFPWTVIRPNSAKALSEYFRALPRSLSGGTGIGVGMRESLNSFASQDIASSRKVMNVVGDGCSNSGEDPATVRNDALNSEHVPHVDAIHGIAVGHDNSNCPGVNLYDYYRQYVVGPPSYGVAFTSDSFAIVSPEFRCKQRYQFLREIHWNSPGCWTDYNSDGSIDDQDIVEFLNAWNSQEPCADFNGDGWIDGVDLDEFINAHSLGCQ